MKVFILSGEHFGEFPHLVGVYSTLEKAQEQRPGKWYAPESPESPIIAFMDVHDKLDIGRVATRFFISECELDTPA